jgi:ribosome-binding ATPase YchF (GTP1/OBG family)
MKGMDFLSAKKVIYVANVSEAMLGKSSPAVDRSKPSPNSTKMLLP